ncbi:MAG: transposase, partial [Thermodesulfobacteriota bacterium]
TFSNFRSRLGEETFYKIYRTLIAQAIAIGVIRGIDFAIDSTHIHAYSNPHKENPSDKDAAWGYKENHKNETRYFFGYKVHMIVDCKSQLPVEITVTPGNEHDLTQALPLLKSAKQIENLSVQNYAADSAYDDYEIYRSSINDLGLTPFIALNPRSSKDKPPSSFSDLSFSYKQGCFQCAAGKSAIFAGYDKARNRFKFRCPAALGRDTCLFKGACYTSSYGRTFYLFPEDDLRLVGKIIRGSRTWQINYAKRTAVERCNSEAKEQHFLDKLRVRGIARVKIHSYLSLSALILKKIAVFQRGLVLPRTRSPAYAFA